ncbi:TlpA disulfide reductase family protein [Marimonas sp. MJW-29]|uniref:TlpA disulfide reductase family protein n=1 Tax=Sulfitobacter sediminis TaxID=3234186 RepID=A0ABV3RQ19_9RHOB
MRKFVLGLMYTALLAGANAALAAGPDILSLREGDMKKLIVHDAPQAVSDAPFQLADDAGTGTLADYRGKYVLLNFWATWCAPCRKEMPQLETLQKEFGGEHFEVVTIATGRNSPQGIIKFFEEAGVENLPRHQDPQQQLASQMAIFGLPITVLIDPEGREIARLRGDAKWDSESAKAIVKALVDSRTES